MLIDVSIQILPSVSVTTVYSVHKIDANTNPFQKEDDTWPAHQILSQALSTHKRLLPSVTIVGHFPASPCLIPPHLTDNLCWLCVGGVSLSAEDKHN